MLTTLLDILGAVLIVTAAAFVSPILALFIAGVFCLLASWQSTRGGKP